MNNCPVCVPNFNCASHRTIYHVVDELNWSEKKKTDEIVDLPTKSIPKISI